MVTFYRSRCDGGCYIDWQLTPANDYLVQEGNTATMNDYDGMRLVTAILAARANGEQDMKAEYELFLALHPGQQNGQTRASY